MVARRISGCVYGSSCYRVPQPGSFAKNQDYAIDEMSHIQLMICFVFNGFTPSSPTIHYTYLERPKKMPLEPGGALAAGCFPITHNTSSDEKYRHFQTQIFLLPLSRNVFLRYLNQSDPLNSHPQFERLRCCSHT